jgi:hypothetical protein
MEQQQMLANGRWNLILHLKGFNSIPKIHIQELNSMNIGTVK